MNPVKAYSSPGGALVCSETGSPDRLQPEISGMAQIFQYGRTKS